MNVFQIAVSLTVMMLLASAFAEAQNSITVASSFVAAGQPVPQECKDEEAVLKAELGSFPLPNQWRWIVICDDTSWRRYLLKGGQADAPSAFVEDASYNNLIYAVYASTEIGFHFTVLRGATLLRPDDPRAQPEHVVAHELAHILLQTEDEDRAERQAVIWLKERHRLARARPRGLNRGPRAPAGASLAP